MTTVPAAESEAKRRADSRYTWVDGSCRADVSRETLPVGIIPTRPRGYHGLQNKGYPGMTWNESTVRRPRVAG